MLNNKHKQKVMRGKVYKLQSGRIEEDLRAPYSSSSFSPPPRQCALASHGSDSEVIAAMISTLRERSTGFHDGTATLNLDMTQLCTTINVAHSAVSADAPLHADALALVSLLAGLQNLQLDAIAPLTTRRFPRAGSWSSSPTPPLFPSLRILRLKGRVSERLGAAVRANCRHLLEELVIIDAAADGRAKPGKATLELNALLCESEDSAWPLVKRLVIRRCALSTCRGALRALPNVRAIDLQHNALTQLCAAQHNYALATLDLGFNQIASLQGANRVLGNIETLVLSFNCIVSTAGIEKLYGSCLAYLHLLTPYLLTSLLTCNCV